VKGTEAQAGGEATKKEWFLARFGNYLLKKSPGMIFHVLGAPLILVCLIIMVKEIMSGNIGAGRYGALFFLAGALETAGFYLDAYHKKTRGDSLFWLFGLVFDLLILVLIIFSPA